MKRYHFDAILADPRSPQEIVEANSHLGIDRLTVLLVKSGADYFRVSADHTRRVRLSKEKKAYLARTELRQAIKTERAKEKQVDSAKVIPIIRAVPQSA